MAAKRGRKIGTLNYDVSCSRKEEEEERERKRGQEINGNGNLESIWTGSSMIQSFPFTECTDRGIRTAERETFLGENVS